MAHDLFDRYTCQMLSAKLYVRQLFLSTRVSSKPLLFFFPHKVHLTTAIASEILWFSIGSVDTFERNLESAQQELGLDPSRSVPVTYKSQIEMSNVVSFLPTLLLLGFLVWSMRRAGSMMGGMGGPGRGGRGGGGMFGGMMQVCCI